MKQPQFPTDGQSVLSLWRGRIPQTMAGITFSVAQSHGLTMEEIQTKRRVRWIAWPRQEAMWRIWRTGRFSYPQIGRYFDVDHTTALYAVRAYERRLAKAVAAA